MGNRGRAEQVALRTKHVQDWQASGLSKNTYCEQHGLNVKSFYRWLTPLKRSATKSAGDKPANDIPFIPVNVISEAESVPDFPESSGSGIRVHVRDKFIVELAIGFDATSLSRLWQTWD